MNSTLSVLIHSLIVIVFVNRYIAGVFLRLIRGRKFDETRDDYEPTVNVVIPMYNEGPTIQETLRSLLASTYPTSKLTITVVDDCSTDDSYALAREIADLPEAGGRVHVLKNPHNVGKRRSITRAVRESSSEIIVSVDSDVVVDPPAIRELVRRFVNDKIAAVGGRVDVRNKHENWLTRMQTVKYHYGYYFMKNLEVAFRRVMCLSGCLTAYRRSVLLELEPVLEHREILGVPIKYGEDRFLTRQIVKHGWFTTMTLAAVCRTTVPSKIGNYFAQQLRWRRSNIVDYAGGMSHVWRLNPLIAIHFFSLFGLLLIYPVLIIIALGNGMFFHGMLLHIGIVTAFGAWYRWKVRKLPASDRVSALSFIPMAFVMPVTYALLTPVAFFTLDSGAWETRGHVVGDPQPEAEPARAIAAEVSSNRVEDVREVPEAPNVELELPAA